MNGQIKFRDCQCDAVLNVQSPTEEKIDAIKSSFYEERKSYMTGSRYQQDIFKPDIGDYGLHKMTYENGVRILNFLTYKQLHLKIITFLHHNTQNWKSPAGKTVIGVTLRQTGEGI